MDTNMPPIAGLPPAPTLADLKARQNFPLAVIAGLNAAVSGAVLWAAATVVTHMQIGLVSIGVGLLIGYAIRETGKGIEDKFRYLGAACAVLGCLLGTVLVDIALFAEYRQIPVREALGSLDPQKIPTMVQAFFKPMDLLFYAIAIYEAFKVSCKWRVKKPLATKPSI